MTFTVEYRDERGAVQENVIEAQSRAACIAEARRRGISPIRVREGGTASVVGTKRHLSGAWIACAILCAVAVGAILIWSVGRREKVEPRPEPKRSSQIKAVSPKIPPAQPVPEPERKETIEKPKFMDTVPYSEMTTHQKRDRARYLAKLALRDKKFGVDVQTADPNDKPMLTNAVHMSFIKYMQPGNMVPPPMFISDKEAYAACSIPVNYGIDDSEEVLLWKSQVEEQLKEMKEYMDQGHSAMEYYELLDRRQQTEAATMNEARTAIYELTRQGKYEEAEETVNAFNEYLKGKGLPTIKLSPKVRHELERRRAAEKERQESK